MNKKELREHTKRVLFLGCVLGMIICIFIGIFLSFPKEGTPNCYEEDFTNDYVREITIKYNACGGDYHSNCGSIDVNGDSVTISKTISWSDKTFCYNALDSVKEGKK